jgi:hypothetical protein
MMPGAAEFLAIGAVIVATAGLLLLGLAVGFRLGSQAAPFVISAWDEQQVGADELREQIVACHRTGDVVLQRSLALSNAAARHCADVPPDLAVTIEQLAANTRLLADQLNRLREQAGRELSLESSKGEGLSTNIVDRTPAAMSLPQASSFQQQETSRASAPSGVLTAEEMQWLGGGAGAHPEEFADGTKRRYPYRCQQFVRVIQSDGECAVSDPVPVWCHDISVTGISFFWPEEPQFERLIISVGWAERPILMQAEVMQSKVVFMHGEVRHLLGCRYTSRIDSPSGGEAANLAAKTVENAAEAVSV